MKTTITLNQIFRNFSRLQRSCFSAVFLMLFLLSASSSWGQTYRSVTAPSVVSGGSITITKPSGLVVGDLMVAQITRSSNNDTDMDDAARSGWTVVSGNQYRSNNSDRWHTTILSKVATASDVSATNFTFTGNDTDEIGGAIMAFSGTCDVTVIGSWASLSNSTDGTYNAPAISTITQNSLVIMFGVVADSDRTATGWSFNSTTMAERYDIVNGNNKKFAMAAATLPTTSILTNIAGSATLSGNGRNTSILLAISPPNTVTAASATPTLCVNTALTNITHTTTDATGIGTATGLPAGVTPAWASNTITISGTPTASGTFNYSIPLTGGCGSVNATGTITVNASTVTSATGNSKTYTGIANATTVSAVASAGATIDWYDASTGGTLLASGTLTYAPTGINVGTYTVYAQARNTTTGCTSAARTSATLTITAKALTITGITANNKVYDGVTTATISGTEEYAGLENGESFIVMGSPVASFATAGVGTGKTVTVTGYSAPSSNYTLTNPSLTANITAATLTITADNVVKATGATLTSGAGNTAFIAVGLVNDETISSVTMTYGAAAASGTTVGTYANQATPSAATGGTFTAANYTISYVSGSITVGNARYSVATGNWNATTTWATSSNGSAGASAPVAGDLVFIERGFTVTVSANAVCGSLQVGSSTSSSGTLNMNANISLSISANLTVGGSGNSNRTGTINFASGSSIAANNLFLGGTATTPAIGTITMTNGGTLTLNGDITINTAVTNVWTPGTGTLILAGTTTLPSTIFSSFNNLTINSGATVTSGRSFSVGGTMTVNGSFIPGATGHVISGAGTLNGSGSIDVNLVSTSALTTQYAIATRTLTNLTVDYSAAGNQSLASSTYGALTTSGSGTKTLLGGTTINNAVTIGLGTTLNASIFTHAIKGNWVNNGTFTPSTSTIQFTGTSAQHILGSVVTTFNNFTVNNSTGVTLSGTVDATVNGTLTLTSGLVTPNTNYFTLGSAGTISGASSSSYINGLFSRVITGTSAVSFPIGKGGNYRPVTFTYASAPGTKTVKIEQFETGSPLSISTASTILFGSRYWSVDQSETGVSYTIGLNNSGNSPTGTVVMLRREGTGSTTQNATSFSTPTYTNSSSFSTTNISNDVMLAETSIPLTVTGATTANKEYDGTNTASVTGGTLVGIVGSDEVTLTQSGTFAQTGVGTGIAITSTSTISGANASAYTLTQPSLTARNITAKAVTITGLTGSNKVYDGSTTATVTGTAALSGLVSSDTANVTLGGTPAYAFGDAAVGTAKAITASGFSISGTASGNYSLTQPTGLTANITAATPTVTVTVGTYTYNASAQGPTVATNTGTGTSYTFSYVGTGSTTYAASSTRPTAAGTYTATATVAANGNFGSASSSATAFTIGVATPSVTVTVGTYTYTGTAQGPTAATNTGTGSSYTFSYVGTGSTTYAASSTRPTAAGTYTATATVAANGNFGSASSSATAFTIGVATPVVTVTVGIYTYTGTAQGPTLATNTGTGTSYTFSYVGTGSTTYAASSTRPTAAGTYTATATVAANGNFGSASSSATAFTIGVATPTVTVTVGTYTYTGTAQGPTAATNTGTGSSYTFSYVGTGSTTYAASSTRPTAAGTYTATATVAANGNFGSASSSATAFTIGVATPTVTVTVGTYTYNGSAQGPNAATNTGTGTSYTFSYVGTGSTTYAASSTRPTDAGTYTATVTVAANGNFGSASSGATSFSVATKDLTITANNAAKCFGETYTLENTAFTSSGLQNGETIGSVTLTSSGVSSDAEAASYSIVPSAATGGTFTASNYSINYVNGSLVVNLVSIGGTVAGGATVCSGTNSTELTLSGHTGSVTRWESSLDNFATSGTTIANTTATLTATNLAATTSYRAVVTSGACAAANSATATVTVTPASVAPTSATASVTTMCGSGSATLTLTGGGGQGATIKWYTSSCGGTLVGTGNNLVVSPTNTTTYYGRYEGSCDVTSCASVTITFISATTTTWNGTTWSNGAPTASTAAIISGTFTSPGTNPNYNLRACKLTVNAGATVLIKSGDTVTLDGALIAASGSFVTFNSGANLIQYGTTNENTGAIVIKRESARIRRLDYSLWSSPVAAQGLQAFSPNTLSNRFYSYNSSTNLYQAVDPSATTFSPFNGYLIRTANTHPTTPATWTGQFTGVPNNGNYSMAFTGYRVIGNPYPSAIDAENFIDTNIANGSITGTVYFWRKTNGSSNAAYCTYNLGGFVSNNDSAISNMTVNPNTSTNIVQVGQGFIVEGTGTSNVVFTNDMRIDSNVNRFLRVANTIERNRIWLNITNAAGSFSQAMIAYMTGATQGVDPSIDGKLLTDGDVSLASLIETTSYAIQGRALPFDMTDVVPMSFKVTTAGDYTITIDHVDGLFSNGTQTVYLRDNTTGVVHNLSAGGYTFTSASGTFDTRFEIIYQSTSLAVSTPTFNESQVVIYKTPTNEISINTGNVVMSKVKIFDIRGRLLQEKKDINASQTLMNAGLTTEVLLVQITSEEGIVVTKKVLFPRTSLKLDKKIEVKTQLAEDE